MYVCLVYHVRLCSECIELLNMPTCYLFLPCPVAESVNETCHFDMGVTIFSDPFWLMVSKGLLFYALSRFMPCLVLILYVPIACCLIALNIAT